MSSLFCASSPFENQIKERLVFVQFVTGGKYKVVRFLVHGEHGAGLSGAASFAT